MNPRFANIVRLLAVAAFAAGACGARAAADAPAPGGVLALQAEFPERKFPELQEILRQGLVNGPSVLISQWNAAAAAQDARGYGGRADLLPRVGGWANYGQTYEQHQGDGAQNRSMTVFLYDLNISQAVYQWNILTNNYQIKQLYQAMSERNVSEARRILAINIRRRYLDIILASNALKLARENLGRLERTYKETEQQIKDGSLAPAALAGPDIAIQNTKPAIMQLENQLADVKRSLVLLTGLPESTIDNIPAEIPALPKEQLRDAVYALSGGDGAGAGANGAGNPPPSIALQNLADGARIAKLNFENTKKILYPKFGVSLDVNTQQRTANYTNEGARYVYTVWGAYASMSWTLFDGLGAQSAKRAAMERLKSAEAGLSQAGRQESADRRKEAADLRVQWEQLQNTERDLALAASSRDITEQDFQNGIVSARQVDDARAGYDAALQNTYAVRANFYIALVTCLSNRGQDPAILAAQQ